MITLFLIVVVSALTGLLSYSAGYANGRTDGFRSAELIYKPEEVVTPTTEEVKVVAAATPAPTPKKVAVKKTTKTAKKTVSKK